MSCCADELPPSFPSGVGDVQQRIFESFDQTILTSRIWTVSPRDASALVQLAQWAAAEKWNLRPVGGRFTWTPSLVSDIKAERQNLMLLNMTPSFGSVLSIDRAAKTVR